jgi:hypothetical protein
MARSRFPGWLRHWRLGRTRRGPQDRPRPVVSPYRRPHVEQLEERVAIGSMLIEMALLLAGAPPNPLQELPALSEEGLVPRPH